MCARGRSLKTAFSSGYRITRTITPIEQKVKDAWSRGDIVRVRGPRNNFQLVESPRYLFIAGGIGITPIMPMAAAAEQAGAEWEFHYGGRSRTSMAFLDALDAAHGPRVQLHPQDEVGLIDLDRILGTPQPDTLVYCCGPEPLLRAVEQRCADWPAMRHFLATRGSDAQPRSVWRVRSIERIGRVGRSSSSHIASGRSSRRGQGGAARR